MSITIDIMNELKYNIWVPPGMNEILGARAIIFNGAINHSDMVPSHGKVLRAGFVRIDISNNEILCFGASTSLQLTSSDLLDKIIISRTLSQQHTKLDMAATLFGPLE